MKIRQLEFVFEVARATSFSGAAKICNATQPTLSNGIAALEEELGGRIFNRTTRSVALTAFGRHILPKIEAVLSARDELGDSARAFHNPAYRLLRIGLSPLVDAKTVDRALSDFRREHPETSIFFKECLLDELGDRLLEDTIDVALVPKNVLGPGYRRCSFYTDTLKYLPRAGSNAGSNSGSDSGGWEGSLRTNAVPDVPVIVTGGKCGLSDTLVRLFDQEGSALPRYPGFATTYQMILDWVDLGMGAGILPTRKISDPAAMARPLVLNDGRPATIGYEWVWAVPPGSKTVQSDFQAYCRDRLPELMPSFAETGRTNPEYSTANNDSLGVS